MEEKIVYRKTWCCKIRYTYGVRSFVKKGHFLNANTSLVPVLLQEHSILKNKLVTWKKSQKWLFFHLYKY